jgi:hypothetical protein
VEMYFRSILSGNWTNSVNCSSRSSNWNNDPLNLNSNNSGHGVTDTEGAVRIAELNSPLADISTLLRSVKARTAKYATAAPLGLVARANVLAGNLL